jgi:amidohydrolase
MEDLIQFRKKLHQNPELSGEEFQTREYIKEHLQTLQQNQFIHIGDTGLAIVFKGEEKGKTIVLRCELDALPIHEINTFEHTSTKKGISHMCGHDGHMTILVGVAEQLKLTPLKYSTVILLFQPAEENGKGAKSVLKSSQFTNFEPDYVLALHNVPGYPLGQVITKKANFTPSVVSMLLKFNGKTAHAAEPHKGNNPSLAIASFISFATSLSNHQGLGDLYKIITPIYTHIGSQSYGISAGHGETHITIRTYTDTNTEKIIQTLTQKAEEIAKKEKLTVDISFTEAFSAIENDAFLIDTINTVAQELNYDCLSKDTPFSWGEDFGLYTQKYKGAMFCLGSGENHPALHNPDYDFPDALISNGIQLFTQLIYKLSTT